MGYFLIYATPRALAILKTMSAMPSVHSVEACNSYHLQCACTPNTGIGRHWCP